ncbi:MAG: hypothetical protein AAB152_11670 [Candidatus Coatesbacteria bacterium]
MNIEREIVTQDFRETVEVEDQWQGTPLRTSTVKAHFLFSRTKGRVRKDEIVFSATPEGLPRGRTRSPRESPQVVVQPQVRPEPVWLYALADTLRAADVRIRRESGRTRASLRIPGGRSASPFMDVVFGVDGLPVSVRTFGIRGGVMDEYTIAWTRVGRTPHPSAVVLVAHSRHNTVKAVHTYEAVRINSPVSGTLFGAP